MIDLVFFSKLKAQSSKLKVQSSNIDPKIWIMRLITSISHPQMRITVYLWNGKYLIKFEAGSYEQSYKIDEMLIENSDNIEQMLTESFLEQVANRFREMHADFTGLMN